AGEPVRLDPAGELDTPVERAVRLSLHPGAKRAVSHDDEAERDVEPRARVDQIRKALSRVEAPHEENGRHAVAPRGARPESIEIDAVRENLDGTGEMPLDVVPRHGRHGQPMV